jgi:imidazole glycerol-phosphate synthase subunit HisH
MKPNIVVVDYERSNLFNVQCALKYICAEDVRVSSDAKVIQNAERLILPGVGAFPDAMNELRKNNLDKIICDYVATGKPLLGICLGMQLLLETSEEFGVHKGLGLIPGKVKHLKQYLTEDSFRIPHIGWSSLKINNSSETGTFENCSRDLLEGIEVDSTFYFAHSFVSTPNDSQDVLAYSEYEGVEFCSIIQRQNVVGCQFHPERSGKSGLKILKNFLGIK